jgi:UDP-perosamine 4-acetyltransferase
MTMPVLIIGGGGHAKVLIDVLRLRSFEILGIVDTDPARTGTAVAGIPVLGDDAVLDRYEPGKIALVNAVGSVGVPKSRRDVFELFKSKGFTFVTVIHPSAVIASDVEFGEGAQVMAGAVIQPGSSLGRNSIVNTRASVDHDCAIGAHVHLAPGVTLSGGVRIGDVVHVGTAATVIQGVTIGPATLIAAGAVVIDDLAGNAEYLGVPARRSIKMQ